MSYFLSLLLQFFDTDGDGVVSEADLSAHIPIASLRDQLLTSGNHQEQKQQHKSKQTGCESDDISDEAHHNGIATVPEKMNLGK